jgi:hypothetical protein
LAAIQIWLLKNNEYSREVLAFVVENDMSPNIRVFLTNGHKNLKTISLREGTQQYHFKGLI